MVQVRRWYAVSLTSLTSLTRSSAGRESRLANSPGAPCRQRSRARGLQAAVLLWGVGLLLLGCGAHGAGAGPRGVSAEPVAVSGAADKEAVSAQLRKQAEEWDRAIVRKDRAAIAANMAEDFRQIDGDAVLETKSSFVEGVMAEPLSIDPYVNEDFEIRLYGEAALLSGRTRMTGRYAGKSFTSHFRYIDVYVRRAGEWKIVSVQITRIKE
ncbi:MAG TPA: hypothetical protein DCQ20_03425 [Nitrospira sp.]|nr:hypothetical protein [Nitrospira sp.]